MSPDTTRPGRMTADEARLRLERERDTRLAELQAAAKGGWAADDHVLVVQKETVKRVLEEIEAAFRRLEEGSYGVCPGCGAVIPVERLEILPYARCCVPCGRRAA
ncbi:TraR/DksA C4-type zinc finger protein [Actinacidiphila sp. bgisy167]|uniref:TraR/DksA C4-type zinc finger protein n=1 Tax=Actinacidiphila sp. bgisy167 TaxID=3413797 RepID=UPI003D758662